MLTRPVVSRRCCIAGGHMRTTEPLWPVGVFVYDFFAQRRRVSATYGNCFLQTLAHTGRGVYEEKSQEMPKHTADTPKQGRQVADYSASNKSSLLSRRISLCDFAAGGFVAVVTRLALTFVSCSSLVVESCLWPLNVSSVHVFHWSRTSLWALGRLHGKPGDLVCRSLELTEVGLLGRSELTAIALSYFCLCDTRRRVLSPERIDGERLQASSFMSEKAHWPLLPYHANWCCFRQNGSVHISVSGCCWTDMTV